VHGLVKLGRWDGAESRFPTPANEGGWAVAVWTQGADGGNILAAVTAAPAS